MNSIRDQAVASILGLYPECVVEAMFSADEDNQFKQDFSFSLNINGQSINFSQLHFLAGVREAYSQGASQIKDLAGNNWTLETCSSSFDDLSLSNHENSYKINFFNYLDPNTDRLKQRFKEDCEANLIPSHYADLWLSQKLDSQLTDEDFYRIKKLFDESIVTYSNKLCDLLKENIENEIKLTDLAPSSLLHYESLIGKWEGSTNIDQYILSEGENHLTDLGKKDSFKSLEAILLFIGTSCRSQNLPKNMQDRIQSVISKTDTHLDLISYFSLLVSIMNVADLKKEIELNIQEIIQKFTLKNMKPFFIFYSQMFMIVDSVLCQNNAFSDKPVFYRRFASLAQAALVLRCFHDIYGEPEDDSNFRVPQSVAIKFYLQIFIDLRTSPYLHSDYLVDYEYFQQRFIAEIVSNSHNSKMIKDSDMLTELISGESGLVSQLNLKHLYLDPITDNVELPKAPEEIEATYREKLLNSENILESLVPFINTSRFWRFEQDLTETVCSWFEQNAYRFQNTYSEEQVQFFLHGLACMASVNGDEKLAESVIRSVKINLFPPHQNFENAFCILLVAVSAYKKFDEWANRVGELVHQLAYAEWSEQDLLKLHYYLKTLCLLEPRLFITCGNSIAAIE